MKIRPVGAEFHADRQTDRYEEANSFRNFGNRPNKAFSLKITFFVYSSILEVKVGNFKYIGDKDYS
jgi:hypothetical protein